MEVYACPGPVSEGFGGEISPSSLELSVVFTLTNEGLRMYIPIGISSPVGERTPARIPETPRSLHAPLANSAPAQQVSLGPTGPAWTLCWVGGKSLDPSPTWSHGLSLAPPLSLESAFFSW